MVELNVGSSLFSYWRVWVWLSLQSSLLHVSCLWVLASWKQQQNTLYAMVTWEIRKCIFFQMVPVHNGWLVMDKLGKLRKRVDVRSHFRHLKLSISGYSNYNMQELIDEFSNSWVFAMFWAADKLKYPYFSVSVPEKPVKWFLTLYVFYPCLWIRLIKKQNN